MITIWKLAPAIAAGNVLIIKTPELAPLYGQKLASLVEEAGFPPGVINIICGHGSVAGQALARHGGVKKIAFTGSAPVGRQILRAAADSNLKKVTLELGGKGPSIVFADADLDNALFWTAIGITANNGQVCAAGSRIYVHASIYDTFLLAFAEKLAQTSHGDPLLSETTKGPVISLKQREKIVEYIRHAKESGIRLIAGGESMPGSGNFIANTAFADVPDDAQIMQEEIFGPVAVSITRQAFKLGTLTLIINCDLISQLPSSILKLKPFRRLTPVNTASAPPSSPTTLTEHNVSRRRWKVDRSLSTAGGYCMRTRRLEGLSNLASAVIWGRKHSMDG